jgi:hypothetical protein
VAETVPLRVNGAAGVGEAGEELHATLNKHEAVHRTADQEDRHLIPLALQEDTAEIPRQAPRPQNGLDRKSSRPGVDGADAILRR